METSFQVEEDLVALNVGICEVMQHLIVPPQKETENTIEHYSTVVTLQYYESALYGMVRPCNFELCFSYIVKFSSYGFFPANGNA